MFNRNSFKNKNCAPKTWPAKYSAKYEAIQCITLNAFGSIAIVK